MGYQAVRTERYKYIYYLEVPGMDELCDLQSDPYEMDNIIGSRSGLAVLPSMQAELARLHQRGRLVNGWTWATFVFELLMVVAGIFLALQADVTRTLEAQGGEHQWNEQRIHRQGDAIELVVLRQGPRAATPGVGRGTGSDVGGDTRIRYVHGFDGDALAL